MLNRTKQIFRKIERGNTLNILVSPTHETYETGMCKTNHNFYSFCYQGFKTWNTKFRPVPNNYTILNGNDFSQIPNDLDIDVVISANKFGQHQILSQIARQLNVPLINVEHTASHFGPNMLRKIHNMKSDLDIFISNWSVNNWQHHGKAVVIHHGVDTETFIDTKSIRENKILTIANDYINRDYCLNYSQLLRVTSGLPLSIYGDTKGLSEPARSVEHLVELYNTHRIFINTANLSPIPSVMLEAAACGCAIASVRACAVEEYLTHGHDCLLSDNDEQLRMNIEILMNNEEIAKRLGENARKTIETKFNIKQFTDNWNKALWSVL